MTTAHGDINIRASHMKLHSPVLVCRKEIQRQGGERLNLATGRGACKAGSYLDF